MHPVPGFVACFVKFWFSELWPLQFVEKHINILEAFCIMVAVATWGPLVANSLFILLCDNEAMVTL
jgi:hypothetical protein